MARASTIGNRDMGWKNVSWVHFENPKYLLLSILLIFQPEGRRYNPSDGYFWMGLTTLKVPMELFAENRRRLVAGLR